MIKHAFSTIPEALADLQQGKMVILVDDESRENEGDLVLPAEFINADLINFMIQEAGGFICLAMSNNDFDRLGIPMMVNHNRSQQKTPFGVPIEAAVGVTTGVSAADRAQTIRVASNPQSGPDDVVMPGHVSTLCANPGGVLARPGHTEGSVDLMKLAGLQSVAVICEIMNKDGTMARINHLMDFAEQHKLRIIRIQDVIHYRVQCEIMVKSVSSARLPIQNYGEFAIHTFFDEIHQCEHVALIREPINKQQPCLIRMHSECLTGDIFGSVRCDCGSQLHLALEKISKEGGVLLYLRQEGRGIGLLNKIKAYQLQDQGMDTVEANQHLGFPPDQREYGVAAQVLRELGIAKVKLLTNNPQKIEKLTRYGIEVAQRVALETEPTQYNTQYLLTKRKKLGHLLSKI